MQVEVKDRKTGKSIKVTKAVANALVKMGRYEYFTREIRARKAAGRPKPSSKPDKEVSVQPVDPPMMEVPEPAPVMEQDDPPAEAAEE